MGAKTNVNLKEVKEQLRQGLQAEIEAEIKTSIENFEVVACTLVSQMDIHQAKIMPFKK
jgi:hypothetical protein